MFWILIVALLLVTSYAFLIVYILNQWNRQQVFLPPVEVENIKHTYSILIPARNEETNIKVCLDSIFSSNHLDHYAPEIIVIDDFSQDNTSGVVQAYSNENIKVIRMSEHLSDESLSGKKVALTTALNKIDTDYIIQLDADVKLHPDHLHTVISYIEKNEPDFLACPVIIEGKSGGFESFQVLDYAGMMAVTQAGIYSRKWYMANGANMAYRNDSVDFKIEAGVSGDDVFAIQDFKNRGKKVEFLKSSCSVVYTPAIKDIYPFLQQRLRWGTKNKGMKDISMFFMMGIPYFNACLFIILLASLILKASLIVVLAIAMQLFIWLSVDYIFLREVSRFYGVESHMKLFIPSKLVHITYLATVGSLSLAGPKFKWKGRVQK